MGFNDSESVLLLTNSSDPTAALTRIRTKIILIPFLMLGLVKKFEAPEITSLGTITADNLAFGLTRV